MVHQIVDLFAPVASGWMIDATVGGGGHAGAVLDASADMQVLGLDQDPDALSATAQILGHHGDRLRLRRTRFDRLAEAVAAEGVDPVVAVLFDLGVSSPQFDRAERGFSYRHAGPRRRGGHPAKRTFQALRIEVNDELTILADSIDQAIDVLAPGGRLAVLSYHSGEDRIVKQRLRHAATGGCTCPAALPCGCGAVPTLRLLRPGGWTPEADEIERNPRAASARLRAGEKLDGAVAA